MLDQNSLFIDPTQMKRADILKKLGPSQVDYAYQDVVLERPATRASAERVARPHDQAALREALRSFSTRSKAASA